LVLSGFFSSSVTLAKGSVCANNVTNVHGVPKTSTFYFLITQSKITDFNDVIGKLNPEKIEQEQLADLSMSPVRAGWEIQKSHFQQYYSCIFLIIYIIAKRKQTVMHLPTPPDDATTRTCELHNFFI